MIYHDAAIDQAALLMTDALDDKATRERALKALDALEWAEIVRSGRAVYVKSSTTRGTWYRVEAGRCTCQAAANGKVCWHRFAARALVLYEQAVYELSRPTLRLVRA